MRRDRGRLLDILEAVKQATAYTVGMTLDEFLADPKCQDAVIRRLEIAGESARRVSSEAKAMHPSIPWDNLISMRNFLIHEYGDVDPSIVWDTLQIDIPPLLSALDEVISSEESL